MWFDRSKACCIQVLVLWHVAIPPLMLSISTYFWILSGVFGQSPITYLYTYAYNYGHGQMSKREGKIERIYHRACSLHQGWQRKGTFVLILECL